MAKIYILVLLVKTGSGIATTTTEFRSMEACEVARSEILADADASWSYNAKAWCFKE